MSGFTAIHQHRAFGNVAIVPARYSPSWWDEDRSKPSALRQAAYKWKPRLCVIHDDEGPRHFITFGDSEGMNSALDLILGPVVATTADLDRLLFSSNRKLLDVLPDEANDQLDHFILAFLKKIATANLGSGFDAIQAKVKLEAIREMTYEDIRSSASQSPEYAEFERCLAACIETH